MGEFYWPKILELPQTSQLRQTILVTIELVYILATKQRDMGWPDCTFYNSHPHASLRLCGVIHSSSYVAYHKTVVDSTFNRCLTTLSEITIQVSFNQFSTFSLRNSQCLKSN